jgi:hypothetical protein
MLVGFALARGGKEYGRVGTILCLLDERFVHEAPVEVRKPFSKSLPVVEHTSVVAIGVLFYVAVKMGR